VVFVADSGGIAPAARHPIEGIERVGALLSRVSQFVPDAQVEMLLINGAVAARLTATSDFATAITFVIEDRRIARIYAMRNPHKLERLEAVAELRR
jgi:RNA polymerase sigma-70 factor (ECF subfamily)